MKAAASVLVALQVQMSMRGAGGKMWDDGDKSSPAGCVLDGPNYFRENFLTVASLQPSAEDLRISAVWIFMAKESVSVFCHPPPSRQLQGKRQETDGIKNNLWHCSQDRYRPLTWIKDRRRICTFSISAKVKFEYPRLSTVHHEKGSAVSCSMANFGVTNNWW